MLRKLALLVPVLVLAGCGATRPGAAAIVDGEEISQTSADETAQVFCRINLLSAQQQGVKELSNAEVRREAIRQMVLGVAADRVAERDDLSIPSSLTTLSSADRAQATQVVSDLDRDTVVRVLEDSQRLYAIVTALGEKQLGQKVDQQNQQQVQQAGRAVVEQELKKLTVRYAPRYGLDPDGTQEARTGSLSTTIESADTSKRLPDTQRCA